MPEEEWERLNAGGGTCWWPLKSKLRGSRGRNTALPFFLRLGYRDCMLSRDENVLVYDTHNCRNNQYCTPRFSATKEELTGGFPSESCWSCP